MNHNICHHYNYTGKLGHRNCFSSYPGSINTKTTVFLIICSLIVLENLTVLVAIWRNHKFHNRMYFFIANLALCDLLAGVAYVVNLLLSGEKTFQLSTNVWFIREGSMFVALSASIFSLLAIAIERHLTMIKMRPYDANKNYRVFLLIGTCWVIAITLGALPILGWNCLGDIKDCSKVLPLYSKKYVAFCITVFMVLLLAMSILYCTHLHPGQIQQPESKQAQQLGARHVPAAHRHHRSRRVHRLLDAHLYLAPGGRGV
ncbi:Sphingosine 1-phosphate receptor 3 [Oryzias melastigma]|uniref:Sphingosine 1-phosphate receptor 3 n=1 Tax=Oryzias melastigma TaxID=30732 RepID=A0A834BWR7_ORYME|nr:Sphingosine 1-phosphate receptor 3 [Oryzias melastigma]